MSIGNQRNKLCHCGSGRKYKKCHYNEDYWADFNTVITKKKVKESIRGKSVEVEKEIIKHFKYPLKEVKTEALTGLEHLSG